MAGISAVIITKNEEKNIERCLQSLKGIVDEIIVVDSFSTDTTQAICEKFEVRFFQHTFNDYSNQKNIANSYAQFEYILSIDADEAVSDEMKTSILQQKASLSADAYNFNRRTNYCGKWIYHCGWYPDNKVRLFKKELANWQGEIHESLILKGNNVQFLKGDLLHYSYASIYQHIEKLNHFTEMAANELFERGKQTNNFKIIIGSSFEFIRKFILQKGFLDGYYGFVISVMSAYYKFFKYAKLKALWKQNKLEVQ